eukprot:COSAG05_NODE_194_length_14555_cov_25.382955_7_plen_673_part_00
MWLRGELIEPAVLSGNLASSVMKRHATFDDAKVYNVSAGKSLPEWQEERAKKNVSLRYDEEYRRRIELISDFDFPTASTQVRCSRDGQYIVATGTYAPRMKIFETSQVGMKCERFMDAEAVTFEILSDDYQKIVFLRADRQVEFHVKYGKYYSTRIPTFGRDLCYSSRICELYCACSGNEVYRLHLEQGRFLRPFETRCSAVNAVELNLQHQLLGCAGADGRVECWDQRQRKLAGELDVAAALNASGVSPADSGALEVSTIKFADDGLTFAAGTSHGHCLLFDLRSSKPLSVKTHNYGLPLVSLSFSGRHNLVSADSKLVKIWNRNDGKVITNIEPPADINSVCVWPDSGLIFMAAETRKVQTFYVPDLGVAPRWCRFLDNLTEELEEEEVSNVYDDYKFVTKEELGGLGLTNLVGTPSLRAYMHGYFMDTRLYSKAKAIAKPFAYETYREEQIAKKIESERENRIAPLKRLPKVNKKLAERMLSGGARTKAATKDKVNPQDIMQDDRFSSLWSDPNFTVDERSDEYARLNPSSAALAQAKRADPDSDSNIDEHAKAEASPSGSRAAEDAFTVEDPDGGASDVSTSDEESNIEEEAVAANKGKRKVKEPKLLVVKDGHDGLQVPLHGKKQGSIKKINSSFEKRLESAARREKAKQHKQRVADSQRRGRKKRT